MEHGSLGEARTKAFLLDRFWVLERSVDIDGADFLIQKRALGARFTDLTPPKLGVVQAKFFQDRATTRQIPSRYVLDDDSAPLSGFFCVLHIGKEEASEMYLLSASEIARELNRSGTDSSQFVIGAKALDRRFMVTSRKLALDRIAYEIEHQTLSQATRVLDRLNIPYRKINVEDIDFRYSLPLPNSQINIPKGFAEYKGQLQTLLWEMEEVIGTIDRILAARDPRTALDELQKLEDYRDEGGHGNHLVIGTFRTDLDWDYFEEGIKEHDKRLAALEAQQLAAAYVELATQLKGKIASEVALLPSEDLNKKCLTGQLRYTKETLKLENLKCSISTDMMNDSKPGSIQMSVYLWALGPDAIRLEPQAHDLWHTIMTEVLRHACPEAFDAMA